MPNQNNSLKGKEASREALSQALGLNLADEITASILDGEDLSIEQLSKHHTLTEIGTTLIRLDALSVKNIEKSCECFLILFGKKFCYPCPQIPPDED